MALSTSELVTDIFSEPSAEGQSGVTPISAPSSLLGPDPGCWEYYCPDPRTQFGRLFS